MAEYNVRANSEETIVFVLLTDGLARNLATATKVMLHLINVTTGVDSPINTVDNPSLLAITNAAKGEVAFTPDPSIWEQVGGGFRCYLDAYIGGKHYSFPSTTDDVFHVTESAYVT